MTMHSLRQRRLLTLILALVLCGCGAQATPEAPTPVAHAAQRDEARLLLARARSAKALALLAPPIDATRLRSALDLLALAGPLAHSDAALYAEMSAKSQALARLLALEDAGRALEADQQTSASSEQLVAAARTLGQRALHAADSAPVSPGAPAFVAAGLLRAASVLEAQYAPEASALCGRALALVPDHEAAQACVARLASAPPASEPTATVAPPVQPAATAAARPTAIPRSTVTPAPPVRVYSVGERKSFEGSGASGAFASCIDVQILGPGGPVGGAVVGFNNGEHSYQNQTDANGYAGRCGLGASTWSVVLFWTPADGTVRGASTTVYLSGAPEQRAAVVFRGR
jgi:hypothetical protein